MKNCNDKELTNGEFTFNGRSKSGMEPEEIENDTANRLVNTSESSEIEKVQGFDPSRMIMLTPSYSLDSRERKTNNRTPEKTIKRFPNPESKTLQKNKMTRHKRSSTTIHNTPQSHFPGRSDKSEPSTEEFYFKNKIQELDSDLHSKEAELADLNISYNRLCSYMSQHDTLKASNRSLKLKLKTLQEKETTLKSLQASYTKLKKDHNTLKSTYKTLSEEATHLKLTLAKTKTPQNHLNRIKQLETSLRRAKAEIEKYKSTLLKKEKEIQASLRNRKENCSKVSNKASVEKVDTAKKVSVVEEKSCKRNLKKEFEEFSSGMDAAPLTLNCEEFDYKTEEALTKELTILQKSYEELKEEFENQRIELEETRSCLSSCEEEMKLVIKEIQTQKEINQKIMNVNHMENAKLEEASKNLKSTKDDNKLLSSAKKSLEGKVRHLQNENNRLEKDLNKARASTKEYSDKLQKKTIQYNDLSSKMKTLSFQNRNINTERRKSHLFIVDNDEEIKGIELDDTFSVTHTDNSKEELEHQLERLVKENKELQHKLSQMTKEQESFNSSRIIEKLQESENSEISNKVLLSMKKELSESKTIRDCQKQMILKLQIDNEMLQLQISQLNLKEEDVSTPTELSKSGATDYAVQVDDPEKTVMTQKLLEYQQKEGYISHLEAQNKTLQSQVEELQTKARVCIEEEKRFDFLNFDNQDTDEEQSSEGELDKVDVCQQYLQEVEKDMIGLRKKYKLVKKGLVKRTGDTPDAHTVQSEHENAQNCIIF
ncbi:unnamed protein product [Moneuplotes crassus]|uniref:Uncharacterized protein n=1 Tax=Euplotes crassus TaxID=5936 RepID=A0AAD2CZZ7_EUPCR|nr:unnamed protein product [Moneuplotes crassus]